MYTPTKQPALAAEEHARLDAEMATHEGYKRISAALLAAASTAGGTSSGKGLAGIAIDMGTADMLIGPFGKEHKQPLNDLFDDARERGQSCEVPIVEGRAAMVEGYSLPLVTLLNGSADEPTLQEAERLILENGYGIPIRSLRHKHSPERPDPERLRQIREESAATCRELSPASQT